MVLLFLHDHPVAAQFLSIALLISRKRSMSSRQARRRATESASVKQPRQLVATARGDRLRLEVVGKSQAQVSRPSSSAREGAAHSDAEEVVGEVQDAAAINQ